MHIIIFILFFFSYRKCFIMVALSVNFFVRKVIYTESKVKSEMLNHDVKTN